MSDKYNPHSLTDRERLAYSLEYMLQKSGFDCKEFGPGNYNHELVYHRRVKGTDFYVLVYTTIVGSRVRAEGKDAIRVVGLLNSPGDKIRPITKNKRVNRTGTLSGIVDRTLTRMRETYRKCLLNKSCVSCGAPLFISKQGNLCCSQLCWTKK